jgi:hypothetical protein
MVIIKLDTPNQMIEIKIQEFDVQKENLLLAEEIVIEISSAICTEFKPRSNMSWTFYHKELRDVSVEIEYIAA